MLQELFRIPIIDWPVYGYGLMLVIGVWSAVELGRHVGNRVGLNGDHFVTIGVLALVSGLFGARLSHVLENLDVYTDSGRSALANFRAAINISNGGLTFYGGFIFATIVLIVFGRIKNIPLRLGMDVVAPCLMVGLAFGRVGCLLNGCCWGQVCDPNRVPWAVTFPYGSPAFDEHVREGRLDVPPALVRYGETEAGEVVPVPLSKAEVESEPRLAAIAGDARSLPVHPTQIYSVLNAAAIAGITLLYLGLRPATGRVFALMLMLYGPSRFALELLRVNTKLAADLTYSMWVSLGVLSAGIALWLVSGYLDRRTARRT